jgi:predicted nucleic acid-binding Zn ribbon protein
VREKDFRSKFKTTGEVLKSLFDDRQKGGPVAEQFLRWKLWMTWEDVVGPSIAGFTEPVAFYRGTLWIWVKNSSWMQQMTFMSGNIKDAIHFKFRKGYVTEVRFTLDKKCMPERDSALDSSVRKIVQKP